MQMIWRAALLFLVSGLTASASEQPIFTRGWIEHARVMPDRLLMTAKLDSGAKTTSIHAEILTDTTLPELEADDTDAASSDDSEAEAMPLASIRITNLCWSWA